MMAESNLTAASEVIRLTDILRDVRVALRIECAEFDANDWPDDLHPADVVEKHLARAAHDEIRRLRQRVVELGGGLD